MVTGPCKRSGPFLYCCTQRFQARRGLTVLHDVVPKSKSRRQCHVVERVVNPCVAIGSRHVLLRRVERCYLNECHASGKPGAIVLLGGGDPGYLEAREIGRQYRLPRAHGPRR